MAPKYMSVLIEQSIELGIPEKHPEMHSLQDKKVQGELWESKAKELIDIKGAKRAREKANADRNIARGAVKLKSEDDDDLVYTKTKRTVEEACACARTVADTSTSP
ncbi:hypothetical protein P171DRAFT_490862 [Karstenula rhodostoma CBS 690.94]|uniref:Lysine-specific demethylase-like domain-containing protein n=1 Tax=Karstenula rhodostoma CBS 690.94 TaxID=1392251 RepID=A0A9P4P997_9PLEO|nr:hypothetical protein P171DRAFT_490862 [Karstenula rhodostoma CBS 690.94]